MILKAYEHLLTGRSSPEEQRELDQKIREKAAQAQAAIDDHFGSAKVEQDRRTESPPPRRRRA